MNYMLWGLGSAAIFAGLFLQWVFWSGFDLPELSNFARKITFIRRTFANVLIVSVGLVLFAIPASQDKRWQLIALCAIIGFLLVVFLLAAWDLAAMRWAMIRDRDRTNHENLKAELEKYQAEAQQSKDASS